jgi:hypothetical protein
MERMARFGTTLNELGLEVSTGRVVDFRLVEENGVPQILQPKQKRIKDCVRGPGLEI